MILIIEKYSCPCWDIEPDPVSPKAEVLEFSGGIEPSQTRNGYVYVVGYRHKRYYRN